MKSMLRHVSDHGTTYYALSFVCPGCIEMHDGGSGLHMLPVNSEVKKPAWTWDGNLIRPTLTPSILTKWHNYGLNLEVVCHSFLTDGKFKFLDDCTHSLKGKEVEMVDLPKWFVEENNA